MDTDKAAVVFISFVFLLVIIISIASNEKAETEVEEGNITDSETPEEQIKECESGEMKNCTTNKGCGGYQICENYKWEECRKNTVICKPGSKMGCAVNNCQFGYAVCNDCGTGYGPCEPV